MISAWSSQQRLVLGQRKVADKSNEITAIPELLQLLQLHGAVVTIDAMGCQREIAAQMVEQKADYVLGLKGNQGTLHDDVALFFDERQDGFAGHEVTVHESCEKGHGRLETRRVVATEDIAWLQQDHRWPGLRSIAKVESRREVLVDGKVEEETHYYISSLPGDAKQIGHAVRSHWGVENGLHWVMDMVFRDDECRIRSMHAPANFATIKHMASNLLRRGKGKHSMRASRHIAAWNEDFRYSLLATRYSLLATRYSLLATRYSLLATRYSLLATRYSLLATRYSLLATRYSLLATRYSLLATRYSLLATHYSLPE